MKTFHVAAAIAAALIGGTRPTQAGQPATIENYFAAEEPKPFVAAQATLREERRPSAGASKASHPARRRQAETREPEAYAVVPADVDLTGVDLANVGEIEYGYIVDKDELELEGKAPYSMAGFNEALQNDEGLAPPAPPPPLASTPGGSVGGGGCLTGNCTTGSCTTGRCATNCCTECCEPFWAHRSGFFGEFMILRPRGADVAYALPRNGVDPATAVPYGNVATANPTYSPSAFRLGGTFALDRCSSFQATYTYFNSQTNGSLFANPPLSVHSLVTDPHTYTTASDSLAALARYRVGFQLADFDYRRLIAGGANWSLNYSVGSRYAHLTQQFREMQPIGPGATSVGSNINFDGGGGRVGLLGERKALNRGFLFYGKTFADILVGNFRSSYQQINNFSQTQVWSSWKDFRPVPILEYELGAGWQNKSGRFRVSGGYYFAAWFNTVSSSNYIQAVQTNNYVNVGNAITFDGFVGRMQYVW
ncbi:MAG TPA: Lpg1974 family pore-forming outer membrane protein [Pirellulales bacterium]|nr:Lpg1974 family pore-forming outer membrane protein [Pirellulales bacterium]